MATGSVVVFFAFDERVELMEVLRIRKFSKFDMFLTGLFNSSKGVIVSGCLDLRLLNFSLFLFFTTKVFEVFFSLFHSSGL